MSFHTLRLVFTLSFSAEFVLILKGMSNFRILVKISFLLRESDPVDFINIYLNPPTKNSKAFTA